MCSGASTYLWPNNVGVLTGINRRFQHDSICETRHKCQCAALAMLWDWLKCGKTWTCTTLHLREMVPLRSCLKMWEDERGWLRVAELLVKSFTCLLFPSVTGRSLVIAQHYITVRKTLFWLKVGGCQFKACVFFINFMSDAKNVNFFHSFSFCPISMTCYIVVLLLSKFCFPCSCWQKVLQGNAGILKKACKTNK